MQPIATYAAAGLPKARERGKEQDQNHPLYAVLHDQANDEMTSFQFRRETLMGHVLTYGNASLISRETAVLWPLVLPDRTFPRRQSGKQKA